MARIAVAACAAVAGGASGIVRCDVFKTGPVALPTIDVLARIALAARRSRRDIRLEHASPTILELLELCGLREVIAGRVTRRRSGREVLR